MFQNNDQELFQVSMIHNKGRDSPNGLTVKPHAWMLYEEHYVKPEA